MNGVEAYAPQWESWKNLCDSSKMTTEAQAMLRDKVNGWFQRAFDRLLNRGASRPDASEVWYYFEGESHLRQFKEDSRIYKDGYFDRAKTVGELHAYLKMTIQQTLAKDYVLHYCPLEALVVPAMSKKGGLAGAKSFQSDCEDDNPGAAPAMQAEDWLQRPEQIRNQPEWDEYRHLASDLAEECFEKMDKPARIGFFARTRGVAATNPEVCRLAERGREQMNKKQRDVDNWLKHSVERHHDITGQGPVVYRLFAEELRDTLSGLVEQWAAENQIDLS